MEKTTRKFKLLGFFVVSLSIAGVANAVVTTIYDETFTGAELDAKVTAGNATYPAGIFAVVGTQLDLRPVAGASNSSAGVLFRMPILAA